MDSSSTEETTLQQLSAESLPLFDEGRFAHEFNDAVREVLDHISKYPYRREGERIKTEARKITVEIEIEPIAKAVDKSFETASGSRKRTVVELTGLTTSCKVYPSKPRYRSNKVSMVTKIRNGQIVAAQFNPANSENPEQLEIDFDE